MKKKILLGIVALLVAAGVFMGYETLIVSRRSPKATAELHQGGLDITVDYCRPSKKGRLLFGEKPAGALVPSDEVNYLANVLAACVNTRGYTVGDLSPCDTLFKLAKPVNGTAPTNTFAAALDIARDTLEQARLKSDYAAACARYRESPSEDNQRRMEALRSRMIATAHAATESFARAQ